MSRTVRGVCGVAVVVLCHQSAIAQVPSQQDLAEALIARDVALSSLAAEMTVVDLSGNPEWPDLQTYSFVRSGDAFRLESDFRTGRDDLTTAYFNITVADGAEMVQHSVSGNYAVYRPYPLTADSLADVPTYVELGFWALLPPMPGLPATFDLIGSLQAGEADVTLVNIPGQPPAVDVAVPITDRGGVVVFRLDSAQNWAPVRVRFPSVEWRVIEEMEAGSVWLPTVAWGAPSSYWDAIDSGRPASIRVGGTLVEVRVPARDAIGGWMVGTEVGKIQSVRDYLDNLPVGTELSDFFAMTNAKIALGHNASNALEAPQIAVAPGWFASFRSVAAIATLSGVLVFGIPWALRR